MTGRPSAAVAARNELIVAAYQGGALATAIAAEFRVSTALVFQLLPRDKAGRIIDAHGAHSALKPHMLAELVEKRINGATVAEVAREAGVKSETMSRFFTRMGAKMPRGAWPGKIKASEGPAIEKRIKAGQDEQTIAVAYGVRLDHLIAFRKAYKILVRARKIKPSVKVAG